MTPNKFIFYGFGDDVNNDSKKLIFIELQFYFCRLVSALGEQVLGKLQFLGFPTQIFYSKGKNCYENWLPGKSPTKSVITSTLMQ